MNKAANTTAAACAATVPYPAQSPIDEMDDAIACLRTIRTIRSAVIADTLGLVDYTMSDAEVMIGRVLDQLDPIRTFLAEDMPFLECRRAWFARKAGAA